MSARRLPARLFHLAEADNVPSILAHGLLSTRRLLGLAGVPEAEHRDVLRRHRPDAVRLSEQVMIRDQRPMPPGALAGALADGLEPGDWYALLNGFVFLWPQRDRMERQRGACGGRAQVVLTFDADALLHAFGAQAFVSPINSGNARRRAAQRGRDTLVPFERWAREGWPTGQRTRPAAEVLFACDVPARAPFLLDMAAG